MNLYNYTIESSNFAIIKRCLQLGANWLQMHQITPVSQLSAKDIIEFTTIASDCNNKNNIDLDYTICMFTTM